VKRFFFFSLTGHAVVLAGLITLATLLARPRMSYYAVDLLVALPSASSGGSPSVSVPVESVAAPSISVPDVPEEAIAVPEKNPKKHPAPAKKVPKPAEKTAAKVPTWATADSLRSEETERPSRAGSAQGGSSNAAATTGTPFPYPWYLKTVSDRLERQWKPPEELRNNTRTQVVFVIRPNGQVSGAKVAKDSGDAFFDQLALRAVHNAGSMPPLPSGFREPELRVFMTFEGKN